VPLFLIITVVAAKPTLHIPDSLSHWLYCLYCIFIFKDSENTLLTMFRKHLARDHPRVCGKDLTSLYNGDADIPC